MSRASHWLPLLQRLTEATQTWAVSKSPDSAFRGTGDVDSVAAEDEWRVIIHECRSWVGEQGLGPLITCTHYPDLLILVACQGNAPTQLLQIDVYSRYVFRGARLDVRHLHGMMQVDERGFRRLRPGTEGLLLLLTRGMSHSGRPSDAVLPLITSLLREDPEGMEGCAAALGTRGRHALAAGRALVAGRWDRREVALLQLTSIARLLRAPHDASATVRRDLRRLRPCGVVTALESGRRVPGELDPWLARVRKSHAVYDGVGAPRASNLS